MISHRISSLCFLTLLGLAGCSFDTMDETPPPEAAAEPAAPVYILMAPTPPPARLAEPKPMLTDLRTTIWRPGYWSYDRGQFTWVPGEIMPKPTFAAAWSPDRWEKRGYGWVFVPGYWQ